MPLGIFHLLIASIRCCFVFRLQIVINNLRLQRCRTWNSYAWIAWRKVCWLVPITTIISIPLCFEYRVDTYRCMSPNGGNLIKSVGVARHSDFGRIAFIKIDLIQALPTIIYWLVAEFHLLTEFYKNAANGYNDHRVKKFSNFTSCLFRFTLFSAVIYFICEWCIRPRFASPIIQKHSPFFSNIRPLLIALIFALSVIHLPATIAYLNHDDLKPKTKVIHFRRLFLCIFLHHLILLLPQFFPYDSSFILCVSVVVICH
ncbi:unnamed protein product [Anisakis simplex]|uniref:G_PROTEIN_RECEP_F1_2 domain-containing protein n=1 Tax=Anisakis simplex TaxID=6269 RepID=A0A0M3K4M2_ANISI|nr:unnamed protein product [Anisakis simplex]